MGPLPQQLGDLVNPQTLGSGKEHNVATAGLQLGDAQDFGLLSAGEFVGLSQDDQKLQTLLHTCANDVSQYFVQLSESLARVTPDSTSTADACMAVTASLTVF